MADINNDRNERDDFSMYDSKEENDSPMSEDAMEEAELVAEARYIYEESTDYLDSNIRPAWERSLAHFRNQHAPGSKYNKSNYRRSRLFRPKPRSSLRHLEAGWAVAGFSTQELVSTEAVDPTDLLAVTNAQINKGLMQYRLEKTIPWFLTSTGAYQDTHTYGVCISHQFWDIERAFEYKAVFNEEGEPELDEDGTPLGEENIITVRDEPAIDLLPPENVRFSPSADWRRPLDDSPYLIHLVPMYAIDVKRRMDLGDWIPRSMAEIASARKLSEDTTRNKREGGAREDPLDVDTKDFEIVWVHRNIVRKNGHDVLYITLGTDFLLAKPVPLTELYPHLRVGERPYVLGISSLETHRNYPASTMELGAPLIEELNDITNQRMDNVRLVLNKRYHVRRGANVDLAALMRNTPGGGVLMTDPKEDVQVVNTPDVTSSSYEEQNRLSVEHDELVGNFSQGTVQSSRQLNETVGGMNLMSTTSNEIQDYSIRLFVETWVEPVLRQLSRMEAYYETDETILRIAGQEAKLYQTFGIDQPTDEILLAELSVTVNIGLGFTNPTKRVERLMLGLNSVLNLPTAMDRLKVDQVEAEVFGALGYKNGTRFFMPMEEYSQQQQGAQPPEDPKIAVARMNADMAMKEMQSREGLERYRIEMERDARMAEIAAKEKITLTQLYERIGFDREKESNKREMKALDAAQKNNEMLLKQKTGSGI